MFKSDDRQYEPKLVTAVDLAEKLHECARKTEERIYKYLECKDDDIKTVYDAMKYSISAGGKRIRPYLVCEFSRILGGDEDVALDFAAAIEMLHTYSLIHDDLPCMDNDDYRRGKPTNHKVFGVDVATLAGDGLLTMSFFALSSANTSPSVIKEAVKTLSFNAGAEGMIGGQIIDMMAEGKKSDSTGISDAHFDGNGENPPIDYDTLIKLQNKKTGALMRAAVSLGCIAAGADKEILDISLEYADNVGLCFQIVDDVLDKKGDFSALGKNIGSDRENGKTTFLSFMNEDKAMKYASELTDRAVGAAMKLENSQNLISLARVLLTRNK
ncbi:MAG: polyprenyl synthetase family protein [Eubacteriales bacterium]|nr:polyprenyl synthetase family protein [Eubacteriales bacterium]